jgi:hypothetical protein
MRSSTSVFEAEKRTVNAVVPGCFHVSVNRNRNIRGAIARLASGQHGVFNRAQAIDAGMHRSAIDRRVNTGE